MKKEEKNDIVLDEEAFEEPLQPVKKERMVQRKPASSTVSRLSDIENSLINCLTNEKVNVQFIKVARGNITDPNHICFGNKHPNAIDRFSVPKLRNGGYTDVLTKAEKDYLEYALGLEQNALSVWNTSNNFWSDANPDGIGRVELKKGDNIFDKSDPRDYIRLAILRAYKDIVAPSLKDLQDMPKATYRYVMVSESDTAKTSNKKVLDKALAYKLFTKIEDNKDKLRTVLEIIEGRPRMANSPIETLQGAVGEIIETNLKLFLQTVQDPALDTKVLLKQAIEAGVVANRGNMLFFKEAIGGRTVNEPLCGDGQQPTLSVAAKWLNMPKNQELKFSLEDRVKQ